MDKINIAAVVVTYNRKELLMECLDALKKQTCKIEKIIVIDNNSNDGTYEELKNNEYIEDRQIVYKKLEKNIGGAGGFYEGMKLAREIGCDWVWIMDDDTIQTENSLEELINAMKFIDDKISYLASAVYGINGECMNVPAVNLDAGENGYAEWYKYLERGIVKIREATFVSLLINRRSIK